MNLQLGTTQKLGWRPFTARPAPAIKPLGRVSRVRICNSHGSEQEATWVHRAGVFQNALIAALFAISTAVGLPLNADAKTAEPLPKPTEFDVSLTASSARSQAKGLRHCILPETPVEIANHFLQELQKIVASRTGGSGSLFDSFKKSVAQPTQVAQSEAAKLVQAAPAPSIDAVIADTSGGKPRSLFTICNRRQY